MTNFYQDFTKFKFPKFIQGQYLKIALTMLPYYAKERVLIMVPYLIRSAILESILGLPDNLSIKLYTRDRKGYLPNIKSGAQPALDRLLMKENIEIYVDKRIHAKMWVIDSKFAIVHSMNGTHYSENSNFETGIVSIDQIVISEILNYFKFVESEADKLD